LIQSYHYDIKRCCDEIQQIIKSDRAMKTTRFLQEAIDSDVLKEKMKKYSYEDEYAGSN
jgi:hypothetical protein